MPTLNLPIVLTYLVALTIVVGGGFWGLVLSDGHPAFLTAIGMGLFFTYLVWVVLLEDWVSPKKDRMR